MRLNSLAALACLTLLPACATIIEGTGQDVTVDTTPPGASCTIDRVGKRLGMVAPTPGSLHVDKSKNDIAVTCAKPGYTTATVAQSPKFVGTTFGNLLLGGGVGFIADAATGANYVYPSNIRMDLAPATPVPLPTASLPTASLPTTSPPGGPLPLAPVPGTAPAS